MFEIMSGIVIGLCLGLNVGYFLRSQQYRRKVPNGTFAVVHDHETGEHYVFLELTTDPNSFSDGDIVTLKVEHRNVLTQK